VLIDNAHFQNQTLFKYSLYLSGIIAMDNIRQKIEQPHTSVKVTKFVHSRESSFVGQTFISFEPRLLLIV